MRPFKTVTSKLYFAADHGGIDLKASLMAWAIGQGIECVDLGVNSVSSVDYPDYAVKVCEALRDDVGAFGLLICRTGIGMSMAANRFSHVRAAVCAGGVTAGHTRRDNDANVLCLGADTVSGADALAALDAFVSTDFLGNGVDGERHVRRVNKFSDVSSDVNNGQGRGSRGTDF